MHQEHIGYSLSLSHTLTHTHTAAQLEVEGLAQGHLNGGNRGGQLWLF